MIFTHLLGQVAKRDPDEVPLVAEYLENYLQYSIGTLYNPAAYRDAGIPDALALRRKALEHPARVEARPGTQAHQEVPHQGRRGTGSDRVMSEPMQAIRAFIQGRNSKIGPLTEDLDLIDSRAIDSLAFVEFIFLLEELTGEPIDPEDLNLDDFRTLKALETRFFMKEAAC